MEKKYLDIYTDGGARGNPGLAAVGVVILDENKNLVKQFGKKIGETTNNTAEYRGVIEALKFIISKKINSSKINFYLDSQLVVMQLKGKYKIKQHHLKKLHTEVLELIAVLKSEALFNLISREQNQKADLMVNQALDS